MEAQLTITSYSFECDPMTVSESHIDPRQVYLSPSKVRHPIQIDGNDWSFPTLICIVTQLVGVGEYQDVISYVDPETGKEVRPVISRRIKAIPGVMSVEGKFAATGPIEVGEKYRFEDCEFPASLNRLTGAFWIRDFEGNSPSVGHFLSDGPVDILGPQPETVLTQ